MSYDFTAASKQIDASSDLSGFIADFNNASLAGFTEKLADRLEDLPDATVNKEFMLKLLRGFSEDSVADIVSQEMVTNVRLVSILRKQ